MTERLLQYIWQHQYYNSRDLRITSGEQLTIIYTGRYNRNQGPDFLDARIRIDDNIWAGHIELHVNGSDWFKHSHESDPNYDNVVLHVVWLNNPGTDQPKLPTLVLQDRIPHFLEQQYTRWMQQAAFMPCSGSIRNVRDLVWVSWKERLLMERLGRKHLVVMELLKKNNHHWEETLWWLVSRNFGLMVNAEAFAAIGMSIPYNVLLRHQGQVHQLEALLLGQGALLEDEYQDEYASGLKKEYLFLKEKYRLSQILMPVHFLRMRPACFPTVRLAQLAMLVHTCHSVFGSVLEFDEPGELRKRLNITASSYWNDHYLPGEMSEYMPKRLGMQMVNSLMVNSIVPLIFTYGEYHREQKYISRALEWMGSLAAERNHVTSCFRENGIGNRNAADTQALLELKSQYCDQRRCLDCAIGNELLKMRC